MLSRIKNILIVLSIVNLYLNCFANTDNFILTFSDSKNLQTTEAHLQLIKKNPTTLTKSLDQDWNKYKENLVKKLNNQGFKIHNVSSLQSELMHSKKIPRKYWNEYLREHSIYSEKRDTLITNNYLTQRIFLDEDIVLSKNDYWGFMIAFIKTEIGNPLYTKNIEAQANHIYKFYNTISPKTCAEKTKLSGTICYSDEIMT